MTGREGPGPQGLNLRLVHLARGGPAHGPTTLTLVIRPDPASSVMPMPLSKWDFASFSRLVKGPFCCIPPEDRGLWPQVTARGPLGNVGTDLFWPNTGQDASGVGPLAGAL